MSNYMSILTRSLNENYIKGNFILIKLSVFFFLFLSNPCKFPVFLMLSSTYRFFCEIYISSFVKVLWMLDRVASMVLYPKGKSMEL